MESTLSVKYDADLMVENVIKIQILQYSLSFDNNINLNFKRVLEDFK